MYILGFTCYAGHIENQENILNNIKMYVCYSVAFRVLLDLFPHSVNIKSVYSLATLFMFFVYLNSRRVKSFTSIPLNICRHSVACIL